MQSIERWLPVVGYEGIYEVSDAGRLRSIDRTVSGQRRRGQDIKPVTAPGGRRTVSMHRDGKQRTRLLHHIVLEAFVGPRPEGMEACHGDGDAANNALSNLRWDTHVANEDDKRRHGTHGNSVKVACPRGHLLLAPNLVESEARKGFRKCRACNVAAARAHRLNIPFPHEFADERYQQLMEAECQTASSSTSARFRS